jgi:succinate-semialdehyde dehydrogenase/glutarate-semialdehyde dehydrogenase
MKLQKIISTNPSLNYKPIGEIDCSTHLDITTKITKARNAQPSWAKLSITERVAILEQIYQEFIRRRDDIRPIISQEIGMPLSVCHQIDIDPGLKYMHGYLGNAATWLAPETTYTSKAELHQLFFEPKGVVGVSAPWNYPFSNFIWGVMQNLVVGNTVVFKHSEECPFTGKLLEEIMQTGGMPEGVFNEIYGEGCDAGEYLMKSAIDLLWFTGSTGVGKHLYQIAAEKLIPAILELGGSAPGIVFKDAELNLTIESLYNNRFLNCGQTCDGLKRLIVHKDIFDEVVQRLTNLIKTKKLGAAQDPTTDIGPLAAERQVITLENQVSDALKKGAKIVIGAQRPANRQGAYYEPTILTNITKDMAVWTQEVFGPVLPVVSFNTEDEAIALANDSSYGLGGYIYTSNKDRALRVSQQLRTGNISINAANYVIPEDPFGGYKDSGLGREHGKQGLRELCSIKLVASKI